MGIVGIDQGTTSTRALLMDERGVPDNRTVGAFEALKQSGFESETLARAGLPLDPYFSGSKLAWIVEHVPAAKTALSTGTLRLGTTDAFFLDRLTDRFVTDVSTASRTSLMNLKTLNWDEHLCKAFGVPIHCLPAIVSTTGDFGTLYVDGQNIPVTASVVDQQAALYGFGCRKAGDTKMTFGTGAFALMVTGNNIVSKSAIGLLSTVAWQLEDQKPVYALDGGVYTASASLNWAKSLGLFNDFSQINSFKSSPAVHSGLVFVPALAGLACPHWSPRARGTWLGLSLEHTPQQLVQAILEGVAFRASEVISAMDEAMPMHNDILIDGGMSKNPYFVQFLSDVTQRTICRSSQSDTTALGTLMLASRVIGNELQPHNEYASVVPDAKADYPITKFRKAVAISKDWCDS